MKKNVEAIIESALRSTSKTAVQEAVNRLLGEDVNTGDTVAIIDDATSCGMVTVGKVRGTISNKGSGFVDVELTNGTVIPTQSSLLIPIKSA